MLSLKSPNQEGLLNVLITTKELVMLEKLADILNRVNSEEVTQVRYSNAQARATLEKLAKAFNESDLKK